MKYLSVCSGIEAASVAWHDLGWEPVGFSEIETFPSAVLADRFPNVPNLGDMTKFKEWNIEPGSIDLLVGGTPCQSFSIAGLRKGLKDPRGNLMLTYGAIADHFRPRWLIWENVPGVLSSNGGRDFGTFLGMLAELGYGFAYRVLDAQYVRVESHPRAVPQRRRRVFVVGYLGDWRRAASVLFESESLSRYTPPSRKARQGITHDIAPSLTASGREAERTGDTRGQDAVIPVLMDQGGSVMSVENDITGTLRRESKGHEPVIAFPERMSSTQVAKSENISPALMSSNPTAVAIQDVREIQKKQNGKGWSDGVASYTIDVAATQGVAFAQNSRDEVRLEGGDGKVSGALSTGGGKPGQGIPMIAGAVEGYRVRRLTPEECERLQGFPTGWTRIPWNGKPPEQCPDGPRYKAIGNSMAVNVMRWIGERINDIDIQDFNI